MCISRIVFASQSVPNLKNHFLSKRFPAGVLSVEETNSKNSSCNPRIDSLLHSFLEVQLLYLNSVARLTMTRSSTSSWWIVCFVSSLPSAMRKAVALPMKFTMKSFPSSFKIRHFWYAMPSSQPAVQFTPNS